MSEKPPDHTLAFALAQAHALDLPLPEAYLSGVSVHLETAFRLASTFVDYPLADEAEPAPIFMATAPPERPKQ
jgi:hypothetical protein